MLERFADLVAPLATAEFLEGVYGRRPHHRAGSVVEPLFVWHDLSALLAQHRLDARRCRLVRHQELCDPQTYRRPIPNRRGDLIPRLQPAAVMEHLRTGATLVLDAVDEMDARVGRLAEDVGRHLHEEVQVNAYASWGSEPGYGPHADDHHVFVVQVEGCKHWRVFAVEDRQRALGDATGTEPVLELLLEAGDVLYLPHGWVHDVTAVGKPSLHLTFGIAARNGTHLFAWLFEQLRERPFLRRDLPRFAGATARRRHAERLAAEFLDLCDGDVVDRFLAHCDGHLPMRTHFGLPWIGSEDGECGAGASGLRFSGTAWHRLSAAEADTYRIQVDGRTWDLPAAAEEVLAPLLAGDTVAAVRLEERGAPGLDPKAVRRLLDDLVREGLLHPAPLPEA